MFQNRILLFKRLLFCIAAMQFLAIFAAFMPSSWIAYFSDWLGVGPFPDAVVARYLARQTSALYAMHGSIVFCIARDLPHSLHFAKLLGLITVGFGLCMLTIDVVESMPLYWTVAEGTSIIGGGIFLLVMHSWSKNEKP